MKAVRLHTPGDTGSLVYEDAAQPRPADGELLIRVHAVGVTWGGIHGRERMEQENPDAVAETPEELYVAL